MNEPSKSTIRVVAAVIERDGKYLITQQRENAVLPLLWEFPGGKVEAEETDEDALRRELKHRLGVEATLAGKLGENVHEYERYSVVMVLYVASLAPGPVMPINVRQIRWVSSVEMDQYQFPAADQATMDALLDAQSVVH
jgi:8-oxo-dGTP diphosphatase